jgi:hypothetical protein
LSIEKEPLRTNTSPAQLRPSNGHLTIPHRPKPRFRIPHPALTLTLISTGRSVFPEPPTLPAMAPDRKPLASTSAAELTGNTLPEPLEPKKQKKLPSCDSCKLRRG